MQRTPVSSSNLRSVGYDSVEAVLEIEFHSGGVYRYSRVPTAVYNSLMTAPSHGSYFCAHIKDVYPYTKLR